MGIDANDGLSGKAKLKIVSVNPEGEDLAAICARHFDPPKVFVSGLIGEGLTLLCAKPKVGKSWLLLSIGLIRAAGGSVFGSLTCKKGKSLLLMLEDSKRRIKDRSLTLQKGAPVTADGTTVFTKWPRGDEGVSHLVSWLDAHRDVDFVGIDVLAKFSPCDKSSNGNGSAYQSDYDKLSALQTLAQERGIAIVVLHHLRKADGEDPLDLVSGTLGITGAADHVIVITGNKDTGHKLVARGRDMPDVAWDMGFDQGQWTVIRTTEKKKRCTGLVARIERDNKILELHERGVPQMKIATQIGCSPATVNEVIRKASNGELPHSESHSPNSGL